MIQRLYSLLENPQQPKKTWGPWPSSWTAWCMGLFISPCSRNLLKGHFTMRCPAKWHYNSLAASSKLTIGTTIKVLSSASVIWLWEKEITHMMESFSTFHGYRKSHGNSPNLDKDTENIASDTGTERLNHGQPQTYEESKSLGMFKDQKKDRRISG